MDRQRSSGIRSLGYNQDQDCFTCCLTSGLRIYNVVPLVEKTHYSKEELGEVSLCEMVFRTNWLLLVRARRPCSLMLLDDKQRAFRAEVKFKSPIRAVKARRDKVAVVLTSSIQVLTLPSFSRVGLLRIPSSTPPLCAISTEPTGPQLLAASAHRRGSVQLLDISRAVKGAQSSSPAVMGSHQTDVVCISMAPNGSRLASASERGTIIRLWDTTTKLMLQELRRGSDHANIYSINFNTAGTLMCCLSDKGTLHVWVTRGPYTRLCSAPAATACRALCGITDQCVTVICEDGTFHKFTFSEEGNCHRSDFDYFLQVGDDDEFLH